MISVVKNMYLSKKNVRNEYRKGKLNIKYKFFSEKKIEKNTLNLLIGKDC